MYTFRAKLTVNARGLYIDPQCEQHPKMQLCAYGMGEDNPRNRKLAERFVKAIEAGKAIEVLGVGVADNKRKYLRTRDHVHPKTAAADLRRLGF